MTKTILFAVLAAVSLALGACASKQQQYPTTTGAPASYGYSK